MNMEHYHRSSVEKESFDRIDIENINTISLILWRINYNTSMQMKYTVRLIFFNESLKKQGT